ncbi:S5A-REDUCTASE domain-containing protein [Mycena kentingensis (nom. inval.)]|nr:S5A-REDUCTASE domain-containing protein [Mycena kentingensis (nom. inval.)]
MNATFVSETAHRVAVYYQTQYNNALPPNSPFGHYVTTLPLIGIITHLYLAAFHINFDDVSVHLNDFVPEAPFFDQMWADIRILQSQGIKIVGMLGGAASGTYVPCLTAENFHKYYPVLAHYVRTFKLDGLDLDVEEFVLIEDIIRLIKQLKHDFGSKFIITLAPVASALQEQGNLSGFDYLELDQRVGHLIDWYNGQFYSGFGQFFPDDQYLEIIDFMKLDPSRLVATTITNPDDAFGFIEIENIVQSALHHFNFGGVAGWEYFNLPGGGDQPFLWAKTMTAAMKGIKNAREEFLAAPKIKSRIMRT